MSFESELQELLKNKASSVKADRAVYQPTMKRARRRRVVVGGMAIVVFSALLSGGVVLGRSVFTEEAIAPADPRPAGPKVTGDDWEGSITNRYPEIARGEFRGRRWILEGHQAGLGPGIDKVDLTFTLEGSEADDVATGEVLPNDDPLLAHQLATSDGSAHVVFGAAVDAARTIEAVLKDGSRHHAHISTGYDSRSTITAQYYVIFLPAGAEGFLYARDVNGVDLETEPIGDTPPVKPGTGSIMSGSFRDRLWEVGGSFSHAEVCLDLYIHEDRSVTGDCFTVPDRKDDERLLLTIEPIEGGGRALLGLLPDGLGNLQIEIGGRAYPLRNAFEPHTKLGFPFAVVVSDDARGLISAMTHDGSRKVSQDF